MTPRIVGMVASRTATDQTNHTVNLPSFLEADDILWVQWTHDGIGAVTFPAGWVLGNNGTVGGEIRCTAAWYRVVGNEGWGGTGNTITVTTAAADQATAITTAIRDGHPTTAPAFGTFTTSSGTATPDPPSLNPADWDVEETLWLVGVGWDLGTTRLISYPAGWGAHSFARSADSGTGVGVAVAALPSAEASIDPGVFTFPLSLLAGLSTIAVRPASAAAEPERGATPTLVTDTSLRTVDGTSHTVDLPDNLAVGDIVIILFEHDGGSGVDASIAASPPWLEMWWRDQVGEFTQRVWWRYIDGSEEWGDTGNSVVVTTTSPEQSATVVLRVRGAALPIATGTPVGGSSTIPNPPSLDPPFWATENTLWIASCSWDIGTTTAIGFPTNYSLNQTTVATATVTGGGVALAARALAASSEDPDTFTLSVSQQWRADTFAILPAETAPAPPAPGSADSNRMGDDGSGAIRKPPRVSTVGR